jgi:hypothetical protein
MDTETDVKPAVTTDLFASQRIFIYLNKGAASKFIRHTPFFGSHPLSKRRFFVGDFAHLITASSLQLRH